MRAVLADFLVTELSLEDLLEDGLPLDAPQLLIHLVQQVREELVSVWTGKTGEERSVSHWRYATGQISRGIDFT